MYIFFINDAMCHMVHNEQSVAHFLLVAILVWNMSVDRKTAIPGITHISDKFFRCY